MALYQHRQIVDFRVMDEDFIVNPPWGLRVEAISPEIKAATEAFDKEHLWGPSPPEYTHMFYHPHLTQPVAIDKRYALGVILEGPNAGYMYLPKQLREIEATYIQKDLTAVKGESPL